VLLLTRLVKKSITSNEMLLCNPRYIQARTPHYVPAPSILVPAIEYVFNMYGNALDAVNIFLFKRYVSGLYSGPIHVLLYQLPYVLKQPGTKKLKKSRKPVEATLVQTRLKVDHMVIFIASLVH
jgi:hypothetical protein